MAEPFGLFEPPGSPFELGFPVAEGMHPVPRLTRMDGAALFTRLAGAFAGKMEAGGGAHPVGRLTRYDGIALYTQLAGSFAGKTAGEAADNVIYIPLWRPRRR